MIQIYFWFAFNWRIAPCIVNTLSAFSVQNFVSSLKDRTNFVASFHQLGFDRFKSLQFCPFIESNELAQCSVVFVCSLEFLFHIAPDIYSISVLWRSIIFRRRVASIFELLSSDDVIRDQEGIYHFSSLWSLAISFSESRLNELTIC